MRVSARPATGHEIRQLAQLANEAVIEKLSQRGGRLWSLLDLPTEPLTQSITDAINSPTELAAVGEIDGSIIGFAMARLVQPADNTPPIANLVAIHVDEPARGVGVGEALMDLVLEWARHHKCAGLESTALPGDRSTKNFFESFGLVARAIRVHRAL